MHDLNFPSREKKVTIVALYVKVACVVNMQLFFMVWCYYNLIIVSNTKCNTKIWRKLYCFWETMYFVVKTENFEELQQP